MTSGVFGRSFLFRIPSEVPSRVATWFLVQGPDRGCLRHGACGAALDSRILRCGKCIEMLFREAIGVGGVRTSRFW